MTVAPMLADFAVRLAFGLALALLLTSWRAVPLGFFRTQAHVMLALLVLAALDHARSGEPRWGLWCLAGAAVAAYLCAIAWGLGLPRNRHRTGGPRSGAGRDLAGGRVPSGDA